jgi:hypothetical protein
MGDNTTQMDLKKTPPKRKRRRKSVVLVKEDVAEVKEVVTEVKEEVKFEPREEVVVTEVEVEPRVEQNENTFIGPYSVFFSGHEIVRFYQNNNWYYSINDIARIPDTGPSNPIIRDGNPEKLAEGRKTCSQVIDGVEVAQAKDIIPLIPYFRGNMPGQLSRWLEKSAQQPIPVITVSEVRQTE